MQSITVTVEGFLVVGSSTWTSVDGIVWDRVERAVLGEQPGFVYEVGAAVGFFGDRVLSYFFLEDTLWGSRDGGVTWHDVAQFDGGYFEIDGPGLPKAFSTITDIIDAGPLVAVGSVVTYSSSEDIGGECLGDTSGGSCRSDAAVFIGTWEESGS